MYATCSLCGATKPADQFKKSKQRVSGLSSWCKPCANAKEVARRTPIREEINADGRMYYAANCERIRQSHREYAATDAGKKASVNKRARFSSAHPEKVAEYCRAYRERHPGIRATRARETYHRDPEKERKRMLAYQKKNMHIFTQNSAKRRAAKDRATPAWLTPDDMAYMKNLYVMAKILYIFTGVPHHVDHIEPIQGKDRCGLHVPANLQIMTAAENIAKHNKTSEHYHGRKKRNDHSICPDTSLA